jgi:hypothetical protein
VIDEKTHGKGIILGEFFSDDFYGGVELGKDYLILFG